MNTKLLSQPALDAIDQYLHFRMGAAECNVPYFNNKRGKQRAALRSLIGKGSPRELADEVELLGLRERIGRDAWTNDILKKFMADRSIGIDCSGLAYYILQAENRARGKGSLDRHLAFPNNKGLLGWLRAKLRPIENADVLTFASEKNSFLVELKGIQPGDFISMTGVESERNHILVVHRVDYQNFIPSALYYTNSIAWPDDGEYGHGVRQGIIEVTDPAKPLLDQKWVENGKSGDANPTHLRAKASKTEIRRLRWWK